VSLHADLDTDVCVRRCNVKAQAGAVQSAGVLMTKAELQRAHKLCEQAGAWLVVDNTYEHFTYDGREHVCISGPHVINVFSMSKVRKNRIWPNPDLSANIS